MSVSAIVVIVAYLLGLIVSFSRPIFALFSYLWIFYNDPSTNWWGTELPNLRYSLIAAVVALMLAIWRKGPTAPWLSSGATKIIIAYTAWIWIQTPWAVDKAIHIEGAILFSKYVVLSYAIYKLTPDEQRLRLFLWAHVIGCFIFGWVAYQTVVVTRLETIGGPGVDDANLLAAHVITGLIAAGFLFISTRGYQRWVAFGAIPFILNTVILTQSRGGFLAMALGGLAAWYLAPKSYRRIVTIAGSLAVVLLLILSNDFFWDRISTVFEPKSDSQATRVQILGPQFQMFLDHPLGAGYRGNELLSPQYMPVDLLSNSGRRSAHNTFMAALVDQGIVGAVLLLCLYGWGALTFRRLKLMDKQGLPDSLGILRAAIGAGLASLFASGLFLNLLKTEVQIWYVMLAASLVALCEQAVAAETVKKQITVQPADKPLTHNA